MPTEEIITIHRNDPRYPELLAQIPDAPAQLYVRGSISALHAPFPLAVIGTRAITSYGDMLVRLFVPSLIAAGATIASGLAIGTDGLAHEVTLTTGGITVAVLGSGADDASIMPQRHLALAHRIIAQGGAVISEYPPGSPSFPGNFPARNRIIAGLSKGLLVTEAGSRSGTSITARLALDYGRDVFAVPGAITSPLSRGTNALLLQGAVPALEPTIILDHYPDLVRQNSPVLAENPHIARIMALAEKGLPPDAIASSLKLPISEVLIALASGAISPTKTPAAIDNGRQVPLR